MTLHELMQAFGRSDEYPQELENIYQASQAEYEKRGEDIAFPLHQQELIRTHNALPQEYVQALEQVAKTVRSDALMLQYLYLLKHVMADETVSRRLLPYVQLPVSGSMERDFAPMFSMLDLTDKAVAQMQERNLPKDIIDGTVSEYSNIIRDFQDHNGYPGVCSYLSWLQNIVSLGIIRINRFNFQKTTFHGNVRVYRNQQGDYTILADDVAVHRSGQILGSAGYTDEADSFHALIGENAQSFQGYPVVDSKISKDAITLPKSQWTEVLRQDDVIISVHIPSHMSLSQDICEASYARAREIYDKHYPDVPYKAFCCFSWMMDTQLQDILGEPSNLTRFQDKYMIFPRKSGGMAIKKFVMLLTPDAPVESFPENTSLQRRIKEHYRKGNYIYEQGGVFF